jgi:hypothetical protein
VRTDVELVAEFTQLLFEPAVILFTYGVASLPTEIVASALLQIATFKEFNKENDPHEEARLSELRPMQSRVRLHHPVL